MTSIIAGATTTAFNSLPAVARNEFVVRDYDLATTLNCGQAFRWRQVGEAWEGVVRGRWVRLRQIHAFQPSCKSTLEATTAAPVADWQWLSDYLGLNEDHAAQLATFPDDEPMRVAVAHCRGLRLLRQEPWECLASFILSSTKQIVQIRQCVELLCERYGEPVVGPLETKRLFRFPAAERLSRLSEMELRECKMGFRAKYLLDAACRVSCGELKLDLLSNLPLDEARARLMQVHGVGRKIADCVLLFSLGFDEAFPIDVWVERALRELYFPKRRVKRLRIEHFAATHFGPHAGLAQQFLFHHRRTQPSTANNHTSLVSHLPVQGCKLGSARREDLLLMAKLSEPESKQ
jgi:N-glycosylase/DNA lyase